MTKDMIQENIRKERERLDSICESVNENTSKSTGGSISVSGADTERHGHPRFYEILEELGELHSDKNHDYADGGDPLGNFKRRAALYAMYPGLDLADPVVVTLVDAMKQLDAALWFLSNKHEAKVEGLLGRLKDIAVYAPIAMILQEDKMRATAAAKAQEIIDKACVEKVPVSPYRSCC